MQKGNYENDAPLGSLRQTLETRHSNRRYCGLTARGAAGEWQECDVARALDCYRHRALMSCAGAELASRFDLAALADVAAETGKVLVVDVADVIRAVLADLAARAKAAATATTAGSAWATRAGSTLRTTKAAGTRFSLFCILGVCHVLANFLLMECLEWHVVDIAFAGSELVAVV